MRQLVLWVGLGLCLCFGAVGIFLSATSTAAGIHPDFKRTWERTDQPVATGDATRTWIWGPQGQTDAFYEPYTDAPDGQRLVQYFDKARMEITDPSADSDSLWYVTNGLLAWELITGEMQIGDTSFEHRQPSSVQIAGDAHPESPTYASFQSALEAESDPVGALLSRTIDRHGSVGVDSALERYEATAEYYVEETGHVVASVFWDFMNSTGAVHVDGHNQDESLFENPFFGVGLPITGAYWMHIPVAGVWQDVLVQCFERRCLTYTPSNPEGWQVETGNVGQHYYEWRYESDRDDVDGPLPDDGGLIGSIPTNEELGPPVPGACDATNQAVLSYVSDSTGNSNSNSWAKGSGGDWPGGLDASPGVESGQQLSFTIEAEGDCSPLEYRVQRYRPEREVEIIRNWSQEVTFSYTFVPEDAGEFLMLIVDVRNQDPRHHFDDRDDYTYLTYVVD